MLKEKMLIRGDKGVGVTNKQRNFTTGQSIDFQFPWSGSLRWLSNQTNSRRF
jgi:hypothetical protein